MDKRTEAERLRGRLELIESRLARFEKPAVPVRTEPAPGVQRGTVPALKLRIDAQKSDADALRARVAATEAGITRLSGRGDRLQPDLDQWISHEIRRQISSAEGVLQATVEEAQKETLDAFVDSVQKRVIVRIARIEQEIARQAGVMGELRDSSVQTERSMQRLLSSLDRLVEARSAKLAAPVEAPRVPEAPEAPAVPPVELPVTSAPAPVARTAPAAPDAAAESPAPEPAPAPKPKARRWSFFG